MDTLDKINDLEQQVESGSPAELVPVHVSRDEVIYLNILQGGQSVEQETGLREYSKLSDVIENPKMQELIQSLYALIHSGEQIPEDISEVLGTPIPEEDQGFVPIESDHNPADEAMADTGEGEDKVLVLMPQDVVTFLDSVQGGENLDPEMGLQQFGMFGGLGNVFKSVARVATTVGGGIGGFMLGGPAGAAAGAYAGNALGRVGTGQSMKSVWGAALPNALYGLGGGLGASAMGYGAASGAAAPIVNGASTVAGGAKTAASPYLMGTGAKASTGAAAAAPGMLSNLQQYLAPAAMFGGSYLLGKKGEKEKEKEELRRYEQERADRMQHRQKEMGYYDTPMHLEVARHYKKGGKVTGVEIVGKGTGQSDHIPRTVPENSWVWDATTVAHSGDGTTNAGQKAIEKFEKMIKKHKLPEVKDEIDISIKKQPLRKVPCALSNGERVTPPHLVAAVGDGSFDKGASVLRKMTKELRRHKASKGLDLPPAAHDLTVYYKKALRGE